MSNPINKPLALITRLFTGIIILAIAIGTAVFLSQTRSQIQQMPVDQALAQVQVLKAAPVKVNLQWVGYGSASATDQCAVPVRVRSIITQIPSGLDVGAEVQAGDLLMQLDPSDFLQQKQIAEQGIKQIQASLKNLDTEASYLQQQKLLDQADAQLSMSEWDRAKNLYERKAATQQDMDRSQQAYLTKQRQLLGTLQKLSQIKNLRAELQAQLDAKKASLARAELDVQRCRITSPLDGVLQTLDVQRGENVSVGQTVARIVNLRQIEVALQLPASARAAIAVGDRVELLSVGSDSARWESSIIRIAPEDDPTTRTLTVYVEFEQSSDETRQLAPGRYVQGIVYAHEADLHWLAPSRSVQADMLMVIRNGRVQSLPAKVTHLLQKRFEGFGLSDINWVVLGASLKPGDMIILTPSRLVSDGKRVEPVVMADQSALSRGLLP